MKIVPFSEVACAILHDSYQPLDMDMILAAVQHFAPEFGLGKMVEVRGKSENVALAIVRLNDYHMVRVEIAHMAEPLEMDGFLPALELPLNRLMFPEVEEVIRRHRAYTIITVRKGESRTVMARLTNEREAEELMSAAPELFNYTTAEEAKRAKLLCNALTRIVLDQQPATLVHWMAHHRLLRPEQFIELRGDDALLLLDMNPQLFSSNPSLKEDAPLGCVLVTSHFLVGKIVVFDEAPVPLGWMMERLHGFLSYCLERGELIGDGETFADEDGDWVMLVRHVPPKGPEHPGEVHLKLLYSREHNIDVRGEIARGGTTGMKESDTASPAVSAGAAQSAQPMQLAQAEAAGTAPAQGGAPARQTVPGVGAAAPGSVSAVGSFGTADVGERPGLGRHAMPSTPAGASSHPDREMLHGAVKPEKEERPEGNWLQTLAASLGISETMAGILVGVFTFVFLARLIPPLLHG